MIAYIRMHSMSPLAFRHMKPFLVIFDSIDDRINESMFECTARCNPLCNSDETVFLTGVWNTVDIAFAEDMRFFTRGRFFVKAMDPKTRTWIGTIHFLDMANAIETEKLTREHESFKTPVHQQRRCMTCYNSTNVVTVDKYIRSPRTIRELKIEKILINGRATIVFWNDGTKTVVKISKDDLEGGKFDIYSGVSYALAKKLFGSNSAFKKEVGRKTEFSLADYAETAEKCAQISKDAKKGKKDE